MKTSDKIRLYVQTPCGIILTNQKSQISRHESNMSYQHHLVCLTFFACPSRRYLSVVGACKSEVAFPAVERMGCRTVRIVGSRGAGYWCSSRFNACPRGAIWPRRTGGTLTRSWMGRVKVNEWFEWILLSRLVGQVWKPPLVKSSQSALVIRSLTTCNHENRYIYIYRQLESKQHYVRE